MRGDFDEDELDDDDQDPTCPWCGCDLFTEAHDMDCDGEDDDEEDDDTISALGSTK